MQPAIEIIELDSQEFTVSVGIGVGVGARCYECDNLRSVAECLRQAAAALGSEFRLATLIHGDTVIGSCQVAAMRDRPAEIAHELLQKRSLLAESA